MAGFHETARMQLQSFVEGGEGTTEFQASAVNVGSLNSTKMETMVQLATVPLKMSLLQARILRARQSSTKSLASRFCGCAEMEPHLQSPGNSDTSGPEGGSEEGSEADNDSADGLSLSGDTPAASDAEQPSVPSEPSRSIRDLMRPRRKTWSEWLRRCVPIAGALGGLTREKAQADVIAGLTVCIMVIPQSMSYANIAGLPYVYGLYSACAPPFVYALFGQCRQLAVGPVAMMSLILSSGLNGVLDEDQCPEWYRLGGLKQDVAQSELCVEQYVGLAFMTAALVGGFQIAACCLRLGFIVSFLGHPVISGFSTGAAIIIGLSQLKYIFGFTLPCAEHVHTKLIALARRLPQTRWVPLLLGLTWLAFLMVTKRLARKHNKLRMLGAMAPLLSCAAGILLVWLCPPLRERHGVAHVGYVPGGIFPVSVQMWNAQNWRPVMAAASSACLIGFMESIAIAKNLASQHGYEVNAGQELWALGMSNVVGSMFSCYPTTGSFSRTAVSNGTGAQTQLSGVVTALGMLLVLLLLTRLVYYLPMFALAAIVINSVMSLIAYDVAIALFRVKKYDFVLWLIAFLGTMFLGALEGIGIAVFLSLMVVIYESVRPQITILWRVPGTNIYRSIQQETRGQFIPQVFIARIGASLYFANTAYVKDMLLRFISDIESIDSIEYLVLELAGVVSIDSTAAHAIEDIVLDFRGRGINTAFCMVGQRVMKTLRKAKLLPIIGETWFCPTVDDAVRYCICHQYLQRGLREEEGLGVDQPAVRRSRLTTFHLQHCAEAGLSNDLHHECTTVFVCCPEAEQECMNEVVSLIKGGGTTIVRAQVEGTRHTYLVKRNGGKLDPEEMDKLQQQFDSLLRRHCGTPRGRDRAATESDLRERFLEDDGDRRQPRPRDRAKTAPAFNDGDSQLDVSNSGAFQHLQEELSAEQRKARQAQARVQELEALLTSRQC